MVDITCEDCTTGAKWNLKPDQAGGTSTSQNFDLDDLSSQIADAFSDGANLAAASACGKGFGAGHKVTKALSARGPNNRQVGIAVAKTIYNACGGGAPFVVEAKVPWTFNVSIIGNGNANISCECLDCECEPCNGPCEGKGKFNKPFRPIHQSGNLLCAAYYALCAESDQPFVLKTKKKTYSLSTCAEARKLLAENEKTWTPTTGPNKLGPEAPEPFFPVAPKTGGDFPPVGSFSLGRPHTLVVLSAEQKKFIKAGRAKGWSDAKIYNEWKLLQTQKKKAAAKAAAKGVNKIPPIVLQRVSPVTCPDPDTSQNFAKELSQELQSAADTAWEGAIKDAKANLSTCTGPKCTRYINAVQATGSGTGIGDLNVRQ